MPVGGTVDTTVNINQLDPKYLALGNALFDQVLGYEDTVLPQLENALLAGHDVIFLGEIGLGGKRVVDRMRHTEAELDCRGLDRRLVEPSGDEQPPPNDRPPAA